MLKGNSDKFWIQRRLSQNCPINLTDCLTTARRLPDNFQTTARRLPDDCQTTTRRLPENCPTTSLRLPANCQTTVEQLPDDCQTTVRQLPDNYHRTAWKGVYLKGALDPEIILDFLFNLIHISTTKGHITFAQICACSRQIILILKAKLYKS